MVVEPTKPKVRARTKAKKKQFVPHARAYIQATYNNTIISLTDPNGNTLVWSSSGHMGFKGPKKATPYASSLVVRDLCDRARDFGIKSVDVFVKGVGSGREAAIRAFNANNINVLSIKDTTPIPHNGCRSPKPRRV
ncbi:MAG: 30S ribosomal protein S11 [Patescibacteria group bacterium]|nr:30S ribosomal protein S11 [Patescibacteria group bacterium]MDD5715076.1 30S ribosomal protein S11 [Patescibacteria group bacterium]